jgi:hypothetical protein
MWLAGQELTGTRGAFDCPMKSARLFLAVILVAAAVQAAEPFNLTLPTGFGAFTSQTQMAGKIEVTNWISKSPTGEAIVVTMSKFSGKILDANKLFASTRDGLVKSQNLTLDSEEKVAGTPASERLSYHSGSNAFLRSRLIASGDRLFQVLYVGHTPEQRDNPAVGTMLDSFAINAQ